MISFPNAKINLGLNILRRRTDGYHDIESVLWPIKMADVLEVIPAPDGIFRINVTGLQPPSDGKPNLCQRAWELMRQHADVSPVHIHLHKVVPAGAGLGGGSSDAAFTLKMLNEIFSCNLSIESLERLAANLGSDCPFFIDNKPALATGRGEVLTPFSLNLTGFTMVIVIPQVHVNTPNAYSSISPRVPDCPLSHLLQNPIEAWKNTISNRFEESVFVQHPLLAQIKDQMYHFGAVYAAMSGSGSAIYGIFSKIEAEIIKAAFPNCVVWHEQL